MREAPERIWLQNDPFYAFPGEGADDWEGVTWSHESINDDDIEYIRADLARLPEDYVEHLRKARYEMMSERQHGWANVIALILEWHEQQQRGGG